MLHLGAARDWDPPVLTDVRASERRGHRGALGGDRVEHRDAPGRRPARSRPSAGRGCCARSRAWRPRGSGVEAAAALDADAALADDLWLARRIDPYRAAAMLAGRAAARVAAADRDRRSQGREPRDRRPPTHPNRPTRPLPASVRIERCRASPSRARHGPSDLAGLDPDERAGPRRASSRSRAASTPRCTGAACGRCGSSPGSARPPRRTRATASCSNAGQGGLVVAFDMPTLMGLDSDDPRSEGEVGRCGVATDSLDDFETLFDWIPLGRHHARR